MAAAAKVRGPLVLIDPPYADVPTPAFAGILAGAAKVLAAEGVAAAYGASPVTAAEAFVDAGLDAAIVATPASEVCST